jgi:hypothetical protein
MSNLYQETLSVFSIHELTTQLMAYLSASPPKIEASQAMMAYMHRRADTILTPLGARINDELIIKLFLVIDQDLFPAFEDLVVHLIMNGHLGIRDLHMNWTVLSQIAASHSYKILAAILAMDFPQSKWYIDRLPLHGTARSNIGMAIALASRINPIILTKWRKADYADKEWPTVVCKIQQVIFDCIIGNSVETNDVSIQRILKKTPIINGLINYEIIQGLYLALAQDDLETVQAMTALNSQASEIFSSHWLAENKALSPRCVVYLLSLGNPFGRRQVCKKHFDWMFMADNLNAMQEVFRLNAIEYSQLKGYFETLPSIQKLLAANLNVTADYGDKTAISLISAVPIYGWRCRDKTLFFQIVSEIIKKNGRQAFDPCPIQHPVLGYIPSTVCISSVHAIIDCFAEEGGYDLIKKTFSRNEIEDITRTMLRNTIFSPGSVTYDRLSAHINHLLN